MLLGSYDSRVKVLSSLVFYTVTIFFSFAEKMSGAIFFESATLRFEPFVILDDEAQTPYAKQT